MKDNLIKISKGEELKLLTSFGEFKKFIKKDFSEKFGFDVVSWKVKDRSIHCNIMVYDAHCGDIIKFVGYVTRSKDNYGDKIINEYKNHPDSSIRFDITEMDYLLCKMFSIKEEGHFISEVEINGEVDQDLKLKNEDIITFYYKLD